MTGQPKDRENTSALEPAAARLDEQIWYVDNVEAVKAPYDASVARTSVVLDPKFFRVSD